MRILHILLGVCVLSTLAASPSQAGTELDLLDTTTDAITAEGGQCAQNLLPEMRQMRRELVAADVYNAADRAWRIEQGAPSVCGRTVVRALRRLREALTAESNAATAEAAQPRSVAITSEIDFDCVRALKATSPHISTTTLINWMTQCRPTWPNECTSFKYAANMMCEVHAGELASDPLTIEQSKTIANRCRNMQCSAPSAGVSTRTSVNLACFSGRRTEYPYATNANVVSDWLTACRSAPVGTGCRMVSSRFNAACFQAAQRAVTMDLSGDSALQLMILCKDIDMQCDR